MMELAKAYVQIVPSADGIKGKITSALGGEASSAGDSAGSMAGNSLVSKMVGIVGAAKIGETLVKGISSAISEGADLQQSIGGIETLFKGSSDTVIKNAQNAFQTAGMSANEYMQSVTGFSASLLQGLGGDTEAAANVADMALTDMSDNANKMGTDMELIQNAYQGFAKQNYTMLDNLKLGYGGTKGEMERLLADAQKLTGVEYNIDNLSDVYSAIHAVQGEMEISGRTAEEAALIAENTGRTVKEQLGTTALEASSTFSGSLAAVKASLSNLAGYMSTGEDIAPAITNLLGTVSTFFFENLVPMVGNVISAVPTVLGTVFETAIPYIQENGGALIDTLVTGYTEKMPQMQEMAGEILTNVMNAITENLPGFLERGKEIVTNLANGILENLPTLISNAGNIVTGIINFIGTNLPVMLRAGADILGNILNGIMNNLPSIATTLQNVFENIMSAIGNNLPNILHAGADILLNLISGIVKNFPKIVSTIGTMIINMVAAIGKNLPKILQSGIEIIGKLLAGIIKAVPELIASIPEILRNIADAFMEKDWGEIGKNIIDGLVNGIKNAASSVWEALKSVISSNFENIAKDFGFGSSSSTGTKGTSYNGTKGAGYNAYPNFAQTIQANTSVAQNASTEAATESKEETTAIDYEKFAGAIVTAFIESDIKVVLDKREMGRMVREVMA